MPILLFQICHYFHFFIILKFVWVRDFFFPGLCQKNVFFSMNFCFFGQKPDFGYIFFLKTVFFGSSSVRFTVNRDESGARFGRFRFIPVPVSGSGSGSWLSCHEAHGSHEANGSSEA